MGFFPRLYRAMFAARRAFDDKQRRRVSVEKKTPPRLCVNSRETRVRLNVRSCGRVQQSRLACHHGAEFAYNIHIMCCCRVLSDTRTIPQTHTEPTKDERLDVFFSHCRSPATLRWCIMFVLLVQYEQSTN